MSTRERQPAERSQILTTQGGEHELYVNIGCGQTPTQGWRNFDNSLSLQVARIPFLVQVLGAVGLINEEQREFAALARTANIEYADATRRIPVPSACVDVLYSSHMLEHLDPEGARRFLAEVRRVLKPKGMVRIAVPDIQILVQQYATDGDADAFVRATDLGSSQPHSLLEKIRFLVIGNRHHLWMYDGRSLCRLLCNCGFVEARIVPPGSSGLPDPGSLNLSERAQETVYVEAVNP